MPPLTVSFTEASPEAAGKGQFDGFLDISWGRECNRFVYECKSHRTPRILAGAVAQAVRAAATLRIRPMVIVPYLIEERLADLEIQGVSGIDLCGILAGGFGIRVKQDYLARTEATTLIMSIPPARATSDLDLILRMDVFMNRGAQESARHAIDALGYSTQRLGEPG